MQKGDVGYIAQGYGHSIENVGSGTARILIGFNAGIYETVICRMDRGKSQRRARHTFWPTAEVFGKFPDRDVFIAGKDGGPTGERGASKRRQNSRAQACPGSVAPI